MTRAFDLLIFDWDGTLADSTGIMVTNMQRAIAALQLPPRPDETIRSMIGLGFRDGLSRLYPERDVVALERQLMAFSRQQPGSAVQSAPLYDGVAPSLQTLRQQGYLLGVATGKSRQGLNHALQHHRSSLQGLFAATRTADETATKPDPKMVHALLCATGVPAERALVIGDTDFDMDMAAAAGVAGVAVTGGAHPAPRLAASPARALLPGVSALVSWLDAQ